MVEMSSRESAVRKHENSEVERKASWRQEGEEMKHRDKEKPVRKQSAFHLVRPRSDFLLRSQSCH